VRHVTGGRQGVRRREAAAAGLLAALVAVLVAVLVEVLVAGASWVLVAVLVGVLVATSALLGPQPYWLLAQAASTSANGTVSTPEGTRMW
jgi:fatty acid desaturase